MKKIKINTAYKILGIAIVAIVAVSCKKSATAPPELTLGNITQAMPEEGGTVALKFSTNAAWSLDTTGVGWLHLDKVSGNSGDAAINVTAAVNSSGSTRSVLLNVNSSNGQSRRIIVTQNAQIYPSYNTSPKVPDASGMGSTASQIAGNITYGWNFYNTMEAPGSETGWGNPPITQQMFDLIKSTGVNAVRIPIQYTDHLVNKKTAQIDPAWLARIKQVIQYGINDDMYVTINIHYDPGSKLTGAQQDSANAKHKAIWEQVATTMRDFDEHLMFASANEPDATDAATSTTLMRYHQTFINAVRSTGGKNTNRVLVIQGPSASIDLLNQYLSSANVYKAIPIPVDPTPHKMMYEFHYYSPSQFCILGGPGTTPNDASWGKELYFWGKDFHTKNQIFLDRNCTSANEEAYVDSIMHTLKSRFADKGIPLFMGEYASNYHAGKLTGYPADSLLALKSATHFTAYVAQQAKANGVIPFLWAGIFDRQGKDGVPQGPTIVGDTATLNAVKISVNAGVDKFGSGAKFH